MGQPLMKVVEFAARIRKGVSTARRIIARGEIDVINVGSSQRPCLRISEQAYGRYLACREVKGRRS
jgi:hypothetical protein